MLPFVAFLVFLASGFAALLYQVIWQRLLTLFSGADIYSATVVVAVFMAGLGIGNLGGGHIADRVSPRISLLLFCVSELAVAGFGVVSGSFFHDLLYAQLGSRDLPQAVVALVIFLSLLWPTCFMGASLPLLARAITPHLDDAAPRIGALYGFNTVGAALGALGATWVLVPMFGLEGSLRVAVQLNLGCALVLVPFGLMVRAAQSPAPTPPRGISHQPHQPADVGTPSAYPFWVWAAIYACSGFIALSLEVVWFRVLGVMVKSTAFTFGTLLTLFLAGLGFGSLVGSLCARRVRNPARAFLLLQAGVGLSAGALLVCLLRLAEGSNDLIAYFADYEHLDVKLYAVAIKDWLTGEEASAELGLFPLIYFGLPALLVVPPTFLMGCSFPILQRLVHADLNRIGRRVGGLLLANIAGSAAGAALTGLWLVGTFGTAGTMKLLVGASAGFLALALSLASAARASPTTGLLLTRGLTALAFAAVIVMMPDAAMLWSRLHGANPADIVFGEDGSGLSVIKTRHAGQNRPVVFVNGLGQSVMPYGGTHTTLAAVPAFVHGSPRLAAVIGLGSGDTVHAMAGHPAIERVVAIEIVRPQLATLHALSRRHEDGALNALLADARIEHVFGDGRAYLMRSDLRFDIIEADALRPTSAYSGNLYSQEYFELIRGRLAERGLAVTWRASERVRSTFTRVFPHVVVLQDMLLGSNEPIPIDRDAIAAQLARPEVVRYYGRAGLDIREIVFSSLDGLMVIGPGDRRDSIAEVNTDLDPRDEFDIDLR